MNLPLLAGPEAAMAGLAFLIFLGIVAIISIISSIALVFVLEKIFKKMNRKNIAIFEAVFLVLLFSTTFTMPLIYKLISWVILILIIPALLYIINVITLNKLFKIKHQCPIWLNIAIIALLLDFIHSLFGNSVALVSWSLDNYLKGLSLGETLWLIVGIIISGIIPALLWAAWFAILGKMFEKRLK